jgi:hypothetical protein
MVFSEPILEMIKSHGGQSATSMMRGQRYSECRIPIEKAGGLCLVTFTFSGLWAPGPGFWVVSATRMPKNHVHE